MTDTYMATLRFITPITTVAGVPTQTINVVANAPQPLVATQLKGRSRLKYQEYYCMFWFVDIPFPVL